MFFYLPDDVFTRIHVFTSQNKCVENIKWKSTVRSPCSESRIYVVHTFQWLGKFSISSTDIEEFGLKQNNGFLPGYADNACLIYSKKMEKGRAGRNISFVTSKPLEVKLARLQHDTANFRHADAKHVHAKHVHVHKVPSGTSFSRAGC